MSDQAYAHIMPTTRDARGNNAPATFVSIVVPTKDRPAAVVDCVQSIFDSSYQRFELFVVDQSADGATQTVLAPFLSEPRFHYRTNRREGYGAASSRNIGLALSSGDIIATVDDDVVVEPRWLETLVTVYAADLDLDFICGRLAAPPYDRSSGYTPEFDPHDNPHGQSAYRGWPIVFKAAGANFSMRRRLLERIGGYDEFCGPGSRLRASDDCDLFFRVIRSGAKWRGVHAVSVMHKHGFRPGAAGPALLRRYQHGLGGNFGRFTRRGDILAGAWFLVREARQIVRATVHLHDAEQGKEALRWTGQRLLGFWHGLLLPPSEGFISWADLRRMHDDLQTVDSSMTMELIPAPDQEYACQS